MAESKELKLYTLPESEVPTEDVVSSIVKLTMRNSTEPIQIQQGYLQSANYVSASTGWKLTPTTGEFNFAISVDSLDIPDTTTANSFHVETDGDTFWGSTPANFVSNPDNAPAYVLKTGIAKFQQVTISGTQANIAIRAPSEKTYTAGESIAINAAVFLEDAAADLSKRDVNSTGAPGDQAVGATAPPPTTQGTKKGQAIQETFGFRTSKIKVFLKKVGTPTDSIKVGIQSNSAGAPDGTFLGSATLAGSSITTGYVEYTFTLDSEVNITANTKYFIVLERTGTLDNTNAYRVRSDDNVSYSGGGIVGWDSTNGWSSETASGRLEFELLTTTVAGRIYNASARTTDESNAFIGFMKVAVAGLDTGIVMLDSEVSGFTGLTVGTQYYLSNTFGAIATSVGTVTRKAGISTSATSLLITNTW